MAHTSTTITAPVNTTDVSTVLAVASHNIGYLCSNKHGKINRWSKYKPVRLNKTFPDRSTDWWRGSDGKCGLVPVYTNNHRNIPGMYTENFIKNGWEYRAPTGESTSPFRLGDFNKYLHNATPPFFEFSCIEKACKGRLFYAGCAFNPVSGSDAATSLGLADIEDDSGTFIYGQTARRATLNDYYFGIVICNSAGTILQRQTAEKTGTAEIRIQSFSASITEGQIYTVYPFISLKPLALMEGDQTGNYIYPLPCVRPSTFKAVSAEEYAGLVINVYGMYTSGKTGAKVTLKVSSAKACSMWGTIYVRHTPAATQTDVYDRSAVVASESSKISIPANGTYTKDYIFNLNAEYYGRYQISLIVRIDNILYEKTGALMLADIGGGAL
ncbi:MAG: hypothetical protein K2M13_11015 [Muribaculaceae bacterium]|nr:hypothetical protein [Muribaculaceae bacterium]